MEAGYLPTCKETCDTCGFTKICGQRTEYDPQDVPVIMNGKIVHPIQEPEDSVLTNPDVDPLPWQKLHDDVIDLG